MKVDRRKQAVVDGVRTTDVAFTGHDQRATEAWLVEPTVERPRAGVLFFHWLDWRADDSNRDEFLAEASRLAARDVVSVLVQGNLPWLVAPVDARADRRLIEGQVAELSLALDLLVASGAEAHRLAVVGHDFGAMYGILLALRDRRPTAYVLMAATPRWGDWYVPYWHLRESQSQYGAAMAGVEPIDAVARAAPAALLFQFARRDHQFVPITTAEQFFAAASEPKEIRWYSSGHRLNPLAQRERDEWLSARLGLRGDVE